VAAKLRERLSVSKQVAQKFNMQRFDLRKEMMHKLRNSIRSKLQAGLLLWKTVMIM
jgi:hypothetical protein